MNNPNDSEKLKAEIASLTPGLELLSDHVIITDVHGNIMYANKAAQANTGYTPDEIIGKKPGAVWGNQMPKEFYESMWKTIAIDKKPFVGEVKNKKKDGTEYWAELRISPVMNEAGEVILFIGIEPDITARKNQNTQAAEAKEKLFEFMIQRELRMKELKKEVEALAEKTNQVLRDTLKTQ